MNRLLSQILQRVTPRMLRSDSPNRPMVVRRRHWFLQETRFLFLTRKGPVEITVKPALILGAAFAGLVGTGVIAAATLFLGYKSVEVVTNESITPAEASAPPTIMTPSEDPAASTQPTVPMLAMPATDTTGEGAGETNRLPEATRLAMTTTPPLAPPPPAVLRDAFPSRAVIPPAEDDVTAPPVEQSQGMAAPLPYSIIVQ